MLAVETYSEIAERDAVGLLGIAAGFFDFADKA
jgi:hypothetical protein